MENEIKIEKIKTEKIISKPQTILLLFKEKFEKKTKRDYWIFWERLIVYAKNLNDIPIEEISKRMDIFFNDKWFTAEINRMTFPAFVKNFNAFAKPKEIVKPKCKKCNNILSSDNICWQCAEPINFKIIE